MDDNSALQSAIQEILTLKWPTVTQPSTPQSPVEDGAVWISTLRFFERLSPKALKTIRSKDTLQREELFAFSFEEMSEVEKKETIAKSKLITQEAQRARAEWARPVLAAVEAINDKNNKKGLPTYAWCPTPELLGGCKGQQATQDQIDALLIDKRVQKALP
jgi:hypothetical protein